MTNHSPLGGRCAPGFEPVLEAFEQNFILRGEVGAAVAVWIRGDLVVNLWGGWADASGQRRWREDTLVSVFSATKGLTSTCVHLLADRGEIAATLRADLLRVRELDGLPVVVEAWREGRRVF